MRTKSTNNDLKLSRDEYITKVIYYKYENFEHYKKSRECSQYKENDEIRK